MTSVFVRSWWYGDGGCPASPRRVAAQQWKQQQLPLASLRAPCAISIRPWTELREAEAGFLGVDI